MRAECKNFESRTYANGDTVRKCHLGLAPEAPWRCPDDCPKYERRMVDVAWSHGTAVVPPTPDEPVSEGIAALLREAQDIVNAVAPDVLADVELDRHRRAPRTGWRRLVPRRPRWTRRRGRR